MNVNYPGSQLAVLVVFCVLGIFLFPSVQGPYSAVHGPATALLAMRSRIRLGWAMALAALSDAIWRSSFLLSTAWGRLQIEPAHQFVSPPPGSESVLRC